ncbi:MAG: hypothetical protein KGI89_03140 [Euryarchaeota archaeon]|nr:hypothetical protein [Euryarchaeota archaeon]
MNRLFVWAAVGILTTVGVLSVAPLPNSYDATVVVQATDVALFVGTYFSVGIQSATTVGHSPILDWTILGLGFAWFALHATYSMTVTVGGHSITKQEQGWFTSIPFLNGQQASATDTFKLAYVPGGQQDISVSLSQNGQVVATASGTMCVGC